MTNTVSLPSLAEYNSKYSKIEECGRGKFGTVYHIKNKTTDKCFAAKHVRAKKKEQKEKLKNEIALLKKLANPHIVKFIEAFESNADIVIITEFLNGGELFDRVATEDFDLTEQDCCLFMRQICRGVEYLHKNNVVHLDLKPENIVCVHRNANNIKIIDFGTARQLQAGEKVKVMCGTPEFVAPEVVCYDFISTKTDMWSIGVICYILLSGFSPFMGDTDSDTFSNIVKVLYDFDEPEFDPISVNAKDFISHLLMKNGRNRMTATQCLEHPWLLEQDIGTEVLSKVKLRQFLARRRWQRFGQAIRAMKRMSDIMIRRRSIRNSVGSNSGSQESLGSWTGLRRHSSFDFSESREESANEGSTESLDSMKETPTTSVKMRHLSIDEEAEYFTESSKIVPCKLPDLIKEIVTNKGKQQQRGKDTVENVEAGEEAGMVKKRITLFENKFFKTK